MSVEFSFINSKMVVTHFLNIIFMILLISTIQNAGPSVEGRVRTNMQRWHRYFSPCSCYSWTFGSTRRRPPMCSVCKKKWRDDRFNYCSYELWHECAENPGCWRTVDSSLISFANLFSIIKPKSLMPRLLTNLVNPSFSIWRTCSMSTLNNTTLMF